MADAIPLCVLVLPGVLEELPFAARGRDLLRAPAVVAVEPARWRTRRLADAVAATQARRLRRRLPGTPRVVVILHPEQYPLARALIAHDRACELWYGPPQAVEGRLAGLDRLASERAALRFDPAPAGDRPAFHANAPLWERLEELAIARR